MAVQRQPLARREPDLPDPRVAVLEQQARADPAPGPPAGGTARRARAVARRGATAAAVAEHVLAAVVADRVEPPLGVQPDAQVAVVDEHALLAAQRPGDDPAPGRLDDHRAAAADHVAVGERGREVVRERARSGCTAGTATTKAPDSMAMARMWAIQPSESSAVGATQICGACR